MLSCWVGSRSLTSDIVGGRSPCWRFKNKRVDGFYGIDNRFTYYSDSPVLDLLRRFGREFAARCSDDNWPEYTRKEMEILHASDSRNIGARVKQRHKKSDGILYPT